MAENTWHTYRAESGRQFRNHLKALAPLQMMKKMMYAAKGSNNFVMTLYRSTFTGRY